MKHLTALITLLLFFSCDKPLVRPDQIETQAKIYQTGYATWYGPGFNGRQTATGEIYDMYAYTAAHRTLPLQSIVRVYNTANGKCTVVRINDRGPVKKTLIIDLSKMAAIQLGITNQGSAKVELQILSQSKNPLGKIVETYIHLGDQIKPSKS